MAAKALPVFVFEYQQKNSSKQERFGECAATLIIQTKRKKFFIFLIQFKTIIHVKLSIGRSI